MYTLRYVFNAWKARQTQSLAYLLFVTLMSQAALGQTNIFIDFGGTEGNGAGASPLPWVTIDSLTQDEPVDLAEGITLTPLDDGFTPNNPAPPNSLPAPFTTFFNVFSPVVGFLIFRLFIISIY